jgi:hypothetical protein
MSGAGLIGSAGYQCSYPRVIDRRRERLDGLAYTVQVLPAAVGDGEDAVWPTYYLSQSLGQQLAIIASPAHQAEFAQLLAALRVPAGAAFTTVVAGERAPATGPANRDAEQQLDHVLPEVRFEGIPLKEAFEQLQDAARANIVVEWSALHDSTSIDSLELVDLRVWDLPLSRVLDALFASMSRVEEPTLGYRVEDGVIRVTTRERLAQTGATLRVYDVRRLAERMIAGDADLARRVVAQVAAQGALPGLATTRPATATQTELREYGEEMLDNLRTLLMDQVDPDSWRDNGGSLSTIRVWGGRLMIYTNPENHREVEEILATLSAEFEKE